MGTEVSRIDAFHGGESGRISFQWALPNLMNEWRSVARVPVMCLHEFSTLDEFQRCLIPE